MVATPAEMPDNLPVVDTMAAMPLALLLHVPPKVLSVSVVVSPVHNTVVPVIPAGMGFTVMGSTDTQPAALVKVITAVPVVMPVSVPVAEPTVATTVLLLLQ
jgi:hypothetical protein